MGWTRRQLWTSFLGSSSGPDGGAREPRFGTRLRSDEARAALLLKGASRYARGKEELLIRHFFRDRRSGEFVDVGCFLAEKNSATCYLERHLGWSGLAIDAEDHSAIWRRLRPRSQFVQAVLTEKQDQPVTFFTADGSSTLIPQRLDQEPHPWQHRPRAMISSTLNGVLDRSGIDAFDFLAISVNGVDRRVLAGLDLHRFRPALIKIACGPGQRLPTIEALDHAGYRLIKDYRPFDKLNRYFTLK